MLRSLSRSVSAAAIVAGVLVATTPAWAHVSIQPPTAQAGGFSTFAVQVPNERSEPTTSVEVVFPADAALAYVSVEPVAGWTAAVKKRKLKTPIEAEGTTIDEVVSSITWTGGRIGPGEFQQFLVSAGPLPDEATTLEFKAIQTYESGEVVRWIEPTPPNGEEPEFPAPVLEVTQGDAADSSSSSSSDGTKALAIASGVISLLAIAMAAGALAVGRKKA